MGNYLSQRHGRERHDDVAFNQEYIVGRELGKGAYATVYEAISKKASLERSAVKIVNRRKLGRREDRALRTEVAILKTLDHPHIIHLYDFFEGSRKYFLLLELCDGGELFDKIVDKHRYTEKEARDVVEILLDAIAYCHDRRIVHRDLKPENLLLASPDDCCSIKIADFGFANRVHEVPNLQTRLGTPWYVAPEVIKGDPYGPAVDVWSIGIIAFILLGGYPPFYDENQPRLFNRITRGIFRFHPSYWSHISDEAKDLISRLLVVDPQKRMTAREALNHEWIRADSDLLCKQDLVIAVEQIRKFNAHRRLKAGMEAVRFTTRVRALLKRRFFRRSSSTPSPPISTYDYPGVVVDEEEQESDSPAREEHKW